MSAKAKIISYLSKTTRNNTLTTEQARAKFHVKNVAARIYDLRKEGHAIVTEQKKQKGRIVNFYRLSNKIA